MCPVLSVSPSGYYAWRQRPVSAREMANRQLVEKIKTVHTESHGTYGSPRVYRELREQGALCSENRVARLMRRYHIRARQTKQYRTTTQRNRAHPIAPNVLKRDFVAQRPDQKWLADITYIATLEGWLYLASILDLCTRRIVGWAMSDRMTADLTLGALKMALRQRQPGPGLIHHSDQGSQYTDHTYQQLLEDHDIQASMNGVGSWYDNAPMESFFGTLKSEWTRHRVYRTRDEARADLFFYIEAFYNRRRRHSALGYVSPATYGISITSSISIASLPVHKTRGESRVANMRICMIVLNNFKTDARVRKEAKSLATDGHAVTVLALRGESVQTEQELDG